MGGETAENARHTGRVAQGTCNTIMINKTAEILDRLSNTTQLNSIDSLTQVFFRGKFAALGGNRPHDLPNIYVPSSCSTCIELYTCTIQIKYGRFFI